MPFQTGIRQMRASFLAACAVSALGIPLTLSAQQAGLQTAFFSPAAAHASFLTDAEEDNRVTEIDDVPYINQVAKESRTGAANFQPTASDLLIGQAEAKFQSGRRFYRDGFYDLARQDFDAAVDLMLQASENPTDRALFELRMEDMVDSIHRFDLSGLGAAETESKQQFDKAPLEDIAGMTFPVDPKIKDKVQIQIKTTTSALPLVVNDVVLGYINYFNGKGRKTIEYGFERAGKYQPMIARILAEEGMPQELIHLAQAESGFLPRAVSRASAEGMWQFMRYTGNTYGLSQSAYSDDRLDPEKATRAAAHYLHDLYDEFHDWYLAIAAYNCGAGAIERAVERTGYADYWELRARHAIPNETSNYVPIILAMTIMEKNAPEYGLDHLSPEQPLEYDTLHLDIPTNLALIGDLTETSTPELQQLNPALLRGTAPTGYDLHVPKGMARIVDSELAKVPAAVRATARLHRVQEGETLTAIAHRYNSMPNSIASLNGIGGNVVVPGDRLVIPAAYREFTAAAARGARGKAAGRVVVVAHARTGRAPVGRVAGKVALGKSTSGIVIAKTMPKAPVKAAAHKTAGTVARVTHKSSALSR